MVLSAPNLVPGGRWKRSAKAQNETTESFAGRRRKFAVAGHSVRPPLTKSSSSCFLSPLDVGSSNQWRLTEPFSLRRLHSVTLSAAPSSLPSLPIVTHLRHCRSLSSLLFVSSPVSSPIYKLAPHLPMNFWRPASPALPLVLALNAVSSGRFCWFHHCVYSQISSTRRSEVCFANFCAAMLRDCCTFEGKENALPQHVVQYSMCFRRYSVQR